jgi:hypothetical protein
MRGKLLNKAKIIKVLDIATDEIAQLIASGKLSCECEDQLVQSQQLLLNLLCELQDLHELQVHNPAIQR